MEMEDHLAGPFLAVDVEPEALFAQTLLLGQAGGSRIMSPMRDASSGSRSFMVGMCRGMIRKCVGAGD